MSDEIPFANYQYEIYLRGMTGQRPARSLDWRELERDALNLLRRGPRGYIAGAAGLGETMRANREAFDHWRLRPRMLRSATSRSIRGRRRQWSNASRFARIVSPSPAAPAMYPRGPRLSIFSASRSNSRQSSDRAGRCP